LASAAAPQTRTTLKEHEKRPISAVGVGHLASEHRDPPPVRIVVIERNLV
jgi:hypothetical protein